MTSWVGILWSCGAIFCWGTALVFLKVAPVRRAAIPPVAMTLFYSLGYLVTAVVAAALMVLSGTAVKVTGYGMLGGALWGIGKFFTVLAVMSPLGLATGQAVQCCCNIFVGFAAGLCMGEELWWVQCVGLFMLAMGLGIVVSPGMELTKKAFGVEGTHIVHEDRAQSVVCVEDRPQNNVIPQSLAKSNLCTPSVVGPTQSFGTASNASQQPSQSFPPLQTALVTNQSFPPSQTALATTGIGRFRGTFLAMGSGVFMGVQTVPFKQSGSHDSFSYGVSGAFGQFLVLLAVSLVSRSTGRTRGFKAGLVVGLPAGLAGGMLLFLAATCNASAVNELGIVGSTLGQMNMVIAGIWGMVLFREIRDWRLMLIFFIGASVAIVGAGLLEWKPTGRDAAWTFSKEG